MFDQVPDYRQLDEAPELAALAILDVALHTAISALFCAYPTLTDPERPYWIRRPVSEKVAQRIFARAGSLSGLVRNYRAALLVASRPHLPQRNHPAANIAPAER